MRVIQHAVYIATAILWKHRWDRYNKESHYSSSEPKRFTVTFVMTSLIQVKSCLKYLFYG